MKTTVRREEYKYYIGQSELKSVETALKFLMKLDPACDNLQGFYTVKSLYFDTPNSRDLDEKMDGILDREKFRIRTYPNSKRQTYKLEKKSKIDSVIEKNSLSISKKDVVNLQNGSFSTLLSYKETFADQCYAKFQSDGYRPVVIVEYDRQAFQLPYCNIRVTIDKNLRTGNGQQDITRQSSPSPQVFLDSMAILEIKFEKYLPVFIQEYLSKFTFKRSAISKFALSQIHISNRPWIDPLDRPF